MFRKLSSVLVTSLLLLFLLPEVAAANTGLKRDAQGALRDASNLVKNDQYEQALEQVRRAEQLIQQLSGENVEPDAPVQQELDPVPQEEEPPLVQQTSAAQVAPSVARFNSPLTITLDSTHLSWISSPAPVAISRTWCASTTGMNSNGNLAGGRARWVIAASCFGHGTE